MSTPMEELAQGGHGEEFEIDRRALSPETVRKLDEAIDSTAQYSSFLFDSLMETEKTFVVSPLFSIARLGAVVATTTGETKLELTRSLFKVEDMDDDEQALMLSQMKQYLNTFGSIKDQNLITASFYLVDEKAEVSPKLESTLFDHLGVQFHTVNFNEELGGRVSKLVEEKTGLPSQVNLDVTKVDPIKASMLFVDFSYFSGHWLYPFVRKSLIDQFLNSDKSVSFVSYLNGCGKFERGLSEDYDCQIIRIPYKNTNTSLTIFHPNSGNLSASFADGPRSALEMLLETVTMKEEVMDAWIPEFSLESTVAFKQHLQDLGISCAFDDKGGASFDLSGGEKRSNNGHFLQDFLQTTIFEVRETGEDESGLTASDLGVKSTFICNSPFAFAVTTVIDGKSLIVYHGAIYELESDSAN